MCRDKTLFFAHVGISCVLGVFCGMSLISLHRLSLCDVVGLTKIIDASGGLYFDTGLTIAGFQSRVGCLFFLVRVLHRLQFYQIMVDHTCYILQGALIAFSSLSALYNVVEIRPLFLRERSSGYYRSVFLLHLFQSTQTKPSVRTKNTHLLWHIIRC